MELKLRQELDCVIGGRTPQLEDLARLTYTDKVVKESMRLYPPAWSLARAATKETEIGGYLLPIGANVVMSPWIMHRDPRFYDRPEQFDPDRWTGGLSQRLPRFAYFPFGGGSRVCIGASFAMMEATLLVATIAQRSQLRMLPGHPVAPLPSITLRPKHGMCMSIQRTGRE